MHTVQEGAEVRYRLLESVRLYGEEKLFDAGEADVTRTRHLRWVTEWLEDKPLELRLFGDDDVISTEKAGILAAVEWSIATEQFDTAAAVASGVDWSRTEGSPDAFELLQAIAGRSRASRAVTGSVSRSMLSWLAPIQRWAYRMAPSVYPTIEQAHADEGPLGASALAASASSLDHSRDTTGR